jgi:signal transduction histidine kinase
VSLLSPHLDVALEPSSRPEGTVLADGAACREILSNLGDNARRHARTRIEVSVHAESRYLRVRMVDDGPGLQGNAREEAFERFVSLDGRGGSGLGLPIGRALATAMGGDLRYDAGFVLGLPTQRGADGPGASADLQGDFSATSGSGHRLQ